MTGRIGIARIGFLALLACSLVFSDEAMKFTAWDQIGVGGNGYLTPIDIAPLEPPHDSSAPYAIAVGLDCGGPFVSYDRGDSWIPLGDGLYPDPNTRWPGFGTDAVAFDPRDASRSTLWIAQRWNTGRGRILCGREQDGRFVWKERFKGSYAIGNIAFAPSNPKRVYAAAGCPRSILNRWGSFPARGRYAPCEPEIYRSDDGGDTWRRVATLPVPAGSKDGHVFTLTVRPDDPNRVYAASDRGVYRSDDGGETWQELGRGPKSALPHRCAFGLALDPKRAGILYVTLLAFEDLKDLSLTKANGTGLFRSTDDGRTWQRLTVLDQPPFFAPGQWGPTTHFFDVAVNPMRGECLYVACTGERKQNAVFRSDDGGKTWARLDNYAPGFNPWFFPQLLAVHASPREEDHVFVLGATAGHYRSLDGGRHFEPFSSERIGTDPDVRWRGYGLEADGGRSIAVAGDPDRPDWLLRVDGDRGISFSKDVGMSFRGVEAKWNEGCIGAWVDPSDANIIYGLFGQWRLQHGDARALEGNFVKSMDGGRAFDAAPRTGLPGVPLVDLAIETRPLSPSDARTKRRLYVCARSAKAKEAGTQGGIYTSADGGATWEAIADGLPERWAPWAYRVLVHPRKWDTLFLATGEAKDGLFQKVGDGPWQRLAAENGLPTDAEVYALAAATGEAGDVLFAAVEVWDAKGQTRTQASGIYRSLDDGQTWKQVFSDPARRIHQFACVDARETYAATTRGVLMTEDGGETWQDLSQGLPLPGRTTHIAIVRTRPSPTIYAGMEGGGHVRCRRLPFSVLEYKRRGVSHYLCQARMVAPGMRAHLDSAWSVESFPAEWNDLGALANLSTLQRDALEADGDFLRLRFGADATLFLAMDEKAPMAKQLAANDWRKEQRDMQLRYRDGKAESRFAVWSRPVKSDEALTLGGQFFGAKPTDRPTAPVQYLIFAAKR
ncbi:MAG: hypothetical protein AB1696_17100 [Planctomycetota bacterium]